MIAIKNDDYCDRLKNRRNEIAMTLAHVQTEQRTVDENKIGLIKPLSRAESISSAI